MPCMVKRYCTSIMRLSSVGCIATVGLCNSLRRGPVRVVDEERKFE